MKLRGKTLVFTALIILAVITSFFIISEFIFIGSSTETENQYTTVVLKNTIHALNDDLKTLNNTVEDWSHYDNAYEFVSGTNPTFRERSLVDATFSRLNINLMIFTDNSGKILYAKAIDLETQNETALPSDLNEEIISQNLTQNVDKSGFISLNGTPMIIVAKPILKSDGEGPSQGTLIMGRYLNEYELENLSENANITITPITTSNIPIGIQNTGLNLNNQPIYINASNTSTITGYSLLNGISGNPSLILKVEIPRVIYKTYEKAILYLTLSIIIAGIIAAIMVYYILDKNILRRMDRITHSILRIRKRNDLSSRIPVLGNDELADLAISVNKMLQSLQKSNYELEKSEKRYRTIFEHTGTAMLMIDEDMNILLANSEFKKIFFNETRGPKQDNKKNLLDLVAEKDRSKIEENSDLMKSGITAFGNYEFQLFDKKGDLRNFFATFGRIPGTTETLVSFMDITEHRKAGRKIKQSLKEKDILLREIHHRVKNNLQIISALLMLQAEEIDDEVLLEKYKESENRIHSMALIHERMYQSKDLSKIEFSDYVQNLIDDLTYAYGFDTNGLKIQIDVGDFYLDIETVMPLGLIINELVSNSLKYAFKDFKKNTPVINIKLQRIKKNIFKLEISDNGTGIPEDINIENTPSLGLQLVSELTKQLDGTIELERQHGTHFTIYFNEPEYKTRI